MIEEFRVTTVNGKEVKVWAFSKLQALKLALANKHQPDNIELVGKPFKVKP